MKAKEEKLTVYEPGAEDPKAMRQREAARVMYDALRRISETNAFFDGEWRLKEIATRALHKVETLSREGS